MISENFADDMWEKYIQTADISNTQYRLVNAYYESGTVHSESNKWTVFI